MAVREGFPKRRISNDGTVFGEAFRIDHEGFSSAFSPWKRAMAALQGQPKGFVSINPPGDTPGQGCVSGFFQETIMAQLASPGDVREQTAFSVHLQDKHEILYGITRLHHNGREGWSASTVVDLPGSPPKALLITTAREKNIPGLSTYASIRNAPNGFVGFTCFWHKFLGNTIPPKRVTRHAIRWYHARATCDIPSLLREAEESMSWRPPTSGQAS